MKSANFASTSNDTSVIRFLQSASPTTMPNSSKANGGTRLTKHATERMAHRSIPSEVIETVIEFGREVHTRGAVIHAIGRKEVEQYRRENIDLSDCEGVQVVCSMEGTVLTVYRNHNFCGLRTGLGRGRYRPAGLTRHRALATV